MVEDNRIAEAPGGAPVDRESMAPIAALMYAVAGALAMITTLLPHPDAMENTGIFALGAVALVTALGMWLLRGHLRPWVFHCTTAAGTALTGLAVYWSGEANSPYAWLLLFVAVFSAYFFTIRQTAAHLAVAGVVYAVALAAQPGSHDDAVTHWLVAMVVVSLAAGIILGLVSARRRLEAERELLLEETMQLARTDALTGLPNRRSWMELLELEVARSRRYGRPLCVAMVDLDHFKRFNDTHGHLAGDELLKEIATAWAGVVRPTDTMARYGGEEFAVLLPDCGLGDAIVVVERLRRATPRDQRCSAGIACWDERESPTDLIARADERLYEAKSLGRDRVVPESPEAIFRG